MYVRVGLREVTGHLASRAVSSGGSPGVKMAGGQGKGDASFLYFAYGSNLLRERLILANPSARFVAVGKLKVHLRQLYRASHEA